MGILLIGHDFSEKGLRLRRQGEPDGPVLLEGEAGELAKNVPAMVGEWSSHLTVETKGLK